MTAQRIPDAGTESLLELHFPARADRMVMVRDSVRSAARYCGFDEQTAQDIVLAVGEACQNAILHAYAGCADGSIVVAMLRGPEGLILRVTDFGQSIDPAAWKPRDLGDLRPGGLGIHFIQELMDSADFAPAPGGVGNVLLMTKKRA
ncbi:MAG TPA: ATP-binding protein [Kiloniellaceae bacterium]|nr:ATP-binding protein [Kiloniellaceae bacterium]